MVSEEDQKHWEAERAKHSQAIAQEWLQRIDLLWDHFKVERGNWRGLVYALAWEHVPGLRIVDPPRKGGRKKDWTFERNFRLWRSVRDAKSAKRKTDIAAIRFLVKSLGEWSPPSRYKNSDETWARSLNVRYQEAKKKHAKFFELLEKNADEGISNLFGLGPFATKVPSVLFAVEEKK